jgi:hypothetical protein
MTPEEARALLNVHFPDDQDTGTDEETWLHWEIQAKLIKDPDNRPRRFRMAELHSRESNGLASNDEKQEHERLFREIVSEAEQELEQRLAQIERGERKDLWTK